MENDVYMIYLTVVSILFGLIGILLGFTEFRRRIKVESAMRDQYAALIKGLGIHVPSSNKLLHKIKNKNNEDTYLELVFWIGSKFSFMSNVYRQTIALYLNNVKKFDYKNLEYMVINKTISSHWEEIQWRAIIGMREENKYTIPPKYFIPKKESLQNDHKTHVNTATTSDPIEENNK